MTVDLDVSVPQLRCFLAVADAGSIAEAGRRLGMSAASVSKALTRLEAAAGVKVLHRSTHALSLTDAGESLLEPARAAVNAAASFAETAAAHASDRDRTGVVRVTAAIALANSVLVPLLGGLDVRIELIVTNKLVDLAEAGIDLAIRSGSLDGTPGHLRHPWFTCPWVLCATPAYLAGRTRPRKIADLAAHDLVAFRNARSGRIIAWPHRDGLYEPKPHLVCDDGNVGWGALLSGAGIGCAPLYAAAQAIRSGAVVELLRPLRAAPEHIGIVRRDRRLTPRRVTKLLAFLKEHTPDFSDLV